MSRKAKWPRLIKTTSWGKKHTERAVLNWRRMRAIGHAHLASLPFEYEKVNPVAKVSF